MEAASGAAASGGNGLPIKRFLGLRGIEITAAA
jgi:hypothetical protein